MTLFTREPVIAAREPTTWALYHDVDLEYFSVPRATLEDIYLELTSSGDGNHAIEKEVVG